MKENDTAVSWQWCPAALPGCALPGSHGGMSPGGRDLPEATAQACRLEQGSRRGFVGDIAQPRGGSLCVGECQAELWLEVFPGQMFVLSMAHRCWLQFWVNRQVLTDLKSAYLGSKRSKSERERQTSYDIT